MSPVDSPIATPYRQAGRLWSLGFHTGVDYAVPVGTRVRSIAAGRVVTVDTTGAYGLRVGIESAHAGQPARVYYCHLSRSLVSVGNRVPAGHPIALTGNTGNTTGPHLHVEARREPYTFTAGVFIDPAQLMGDPDMPLTPDDLKAIKSTVSSALYETRGLDGRNLFDSVIQTRNELRDRATEGAVHALRQAGATAVDVGALAKAIVSEFFKARP